MAGRQQDCKKLLRNEVINDCLGNVRYDLGACGQSTLALGSSNIVILHLTGSLGEAIRDLKP